VSPSDPKPLPLATRLAAPRQRGSIHPRDFTLPKPYHKKPFVEDEPESSRLRMAVLGVSGLVAAGVLAGLAYLATDSLETRPVPVIAAPMDAPAAVPDMPHARPAASRRPALAAAVVRTALPAPKPPAASKALHMVRMAPKVEAPAPDPDVALIAAILLLTPPAEAQPQTCSAEPANDAGCHALHGMEP
jgi:hypothetical protein